MSQHVSGFPYFLRKNKYYFLLLRFVHPSICWWVFGLLPLLATVNNAALTRVCTFSDFLKMICNDFKAMVSAAARFTFPF